jgi:cytidylate kinase
MTKKVSVITISADEGCGEVEIARELARTLKFKVLDEKTLTNAITDVSLPPKIGDSAFVPDIPLSCILVPDRDAYGLIDLDSLQAKLIAKPYTPPKTPPDYTALIEFMIREIANEGKVVILAPAAAFVLKGREEVVNVRLFAPFNERVERIATTDALEPAGVKAELLEADKKRAEFMHTHYVDNWTDPNYYHMVINTAQVPIGTAMRSIVDFVRELERAINAVNPKTVHRSYTDLLKNESYTVKEAGELLMIDPDLIREAIYRGEMHGVTIDHNLMRVSRESLLSWLRHPVLN